MFTLDCPLVTLMLTVTHVIVERGAGLKGPEQDYSTRQEDRVWRWVYYNEIPICPMFYLLQGGYNPNIHPMII